MYKFKASKYKNAAPAIAKKEECVTDFTVETPVSFGNNAAASGKLVAFCVGTAGGGKVMVLDTDAKGRLGMGPVLNAHSDAITAMEFSPFNHCRLATGSADNTVKIWDLPVDGVTEQFNDGPSAKLTGFTGRPECVAFNPVAMDILAISCGSKLVIADTEQGENVLEMDTECDLVQSISWKKDGSLIAGTSKDCRLFICDPHDSKVLAETKAHGNHKESRVVWIGETNYIITTGFSSSRQKELKVWSFVAGKLTCLQTESFGTGTGILMPFYDEDTGMLFIAAKGDSNVSFLEFFEGKDPPLKLATAQMLQNQTKGMCALPKLGVKAAEGEVNRLYQLAQKMLVPVPWIVPRRSLRDFPADLFPETASDEPALTADEWLNGDTKQRKKTSLDPSKRKPLRVHGNVASSKQAPAEPVKKEQPKAKVSDTPSEPKPAAKPRETKKVEEKPAQEPAKPKYKPFTGVRQSKFRHWTCKVSHPKTHVTNIEPISLSLSPGTDMLKCSELYAAVPLKGPGGQVAIINVTEPGRMTSSNSLTLQNSKGVIDMQWNPFNPSQIAIALENSNINVWNIPSNKYGEMLEEPEITYKGHYSKPVVLCYHPLAENVVASAEVDGRIVIWDSSTAETYIEISIEEIEIMSLAWSRSGKFIAASAKDKQIRTFEPRKSVEPIQVGPGPSGVRTSRLAWTCDDKFIAVSGFNERSGRVISLHSASDLSAGPISSLEYPNSPSVMILHYDADGSTLLFTGKGDTTMYSAEVSEAEPPHLFELATFSFDFPVQGVSFLSKKKIDARKVEFAQAFCVTKSTLQGLSFTVPRVKMEYFQDDLFPSTPVTWERTMSASDWVNGANKTPKKLDLRPKDMKPLSEAPPDEVKERKYQSYNPATYKTDEQKKEELLEAMSGKLDLDKELEQDTMEGVDEDEWDDY